ncbi:MAG: hypothetical protein J6T51_01240 [Kiritimatiellae bacterium]|nr:hypothetical protein [Kiritimatiellia bacterium]
MNKMIAVAAIAASAMVSTRSFADTTIAENVTLNADTDWRADGVVTVPEGVTVDLNGYTLWVSGLAGAGTFTSSVTDPATFDLTTTDASKVSSPTTFPSGISPANFFNNNFDRGDPTADDLNSKRIIVSNENLPIIVDYDFGAATSVNSYKVYAGGYRGKTANQNSGHERTAKHWKFYGSNDEGDDKAWTPLDERTVTDWNDKTAPDCKQFTFFNGTAYRYYRMEIIEPQELSNGHTELVQLEYGCVPNQVRIDLSPSASFASASNTVSGTAKFVIGGALPSSTDLRGLSKVTLVPNETLDLAGHCLKVHAIDGAGKLIASTAFPDLTSPSEARSRVSTTTNGVAVVMAGGDKYPGSAAFDNDVTTRTTGDASNPCSFLYCADFSSATGLEINYDFGTPTHINSYRIYGTASSSYSSVPKAWAFEGSNDGGETWTTLDTRSNQSLAISTWAKYTFNNDDSYTIYRLRVTAVTGTGGNSTKCYIYELEYGEAPNNMLYIDAGGFAESDLSGIDISSGVTKVLSAGGTLVLSGDLDLSGFTIDGTVDLNGNDLTVDSLAGNGTITDSTDFDLTDDDENRVSTSATCLSSGVAAAAFKNYDAYNMSGQRVIADLDAKPLPVWIDYDFRTATVVNAYRLKVGGNSGSESGARTTLKARAPKSFSFWGSNEGGDGEWVKLDERANETAWYIEQSYQEERQYEFENTTPYRYYRIEFQANNGNRYLEFFKLEYGNIDAAGHLHVVVPSGKTVNNTTVAITGNLRLVKEGDGVLTATKTGQKYGCGTEVKRGRLTLGATGNNTPLGLAGTEVTVCSNAVVELNGKENFYFYSFNMAGGTMQNTGSSIAYSKAQLKRVRLTEDSMFNASNDFGFIGEGNSDTAVYLNGHTLELQIGTGKYFRSYNTSYINGTVDITSGGWFMAGGSYVTATNVDFKMNCALYMAQQFNVRGYEANFYSTGSNSQYAQMTVAGVFKPTVAAYYGCTMLAGSTMDLTAWPGSWPMSSAFGANGKTNLEFADSGEITVNLAGRTDLKTLARSADPHLFTWTVVDGNPVIPGAEFVLDPDTTAAGYRVRKDTTGLRLIYCKGFMLIVK